MCAQHSYVDMIMISVSECDLLWKGGVLADEMSKDELLQDFGGL